MAVTTQRVAVTNPEYVTSIFQASPADAAFFVAPFDLTIKQVQQIHGAAGSDGGAVTLQLERLQGTEAEGGNGDALLSTALNMKSTADTVQTGNLVGTDVVNLSQGDRIGLDYTGTLTGLANVAVTIVYQKS